MPSASSRAALVILVWSSFIPVSRLGLAGASVSIAMVLVFAGAILWCAMYGFTLEKVAYKPLRNAPRLAPLISALGMSIFLQAFVFLAQGARPKVFPDVFALAGFTVGGAKVSYIQLFIFVVSVLLMVGLSYVIRETKIGKAMRAAAQDRRMAALVGINVDRVISATFVLGSVLAAVAGVMVAMYYGFVDYFIGEAFAAGYVSSEYKDAFAFGILVLVLVLRPAGLLGERTPQKV